MFGDPLANALVTFTLAASCTIFFGIYITRLADEIAARTAIGRAVVGALLLGALTSVAEVGTSISAAVQNHPELAVTNAVGSIAAQTAFLVIADLAYRGANLEHAAASAANLMLVTLLLGLLALAILGTATPTLSVGFVHPASAGLVIIYIYGMWLVAKTGNWPMWHARQTAHTNQEQSREIQSSGPLSLLLTQFEATGVLLVLSGVMLANSGIAIAEIAGVSETFVGALLTGVASSAPELVTAITAVRIGAPSLAISNIIGGNAFDTIILALADFSYTGGSILANAGNQLLPMLALTLLMNIVVLLGMLRREQHGLANIGFEGVALLGLYGAFVAYLLLH